MASKYQPTSERRAIIRYGDVQSREEPTNRYHSPTKPNWIGNPYVITYIYMQIYIYAYIHYNHIYTCVYIYMVSCSVFLPPQWYGSPGSTPFPSICKLLAAFLRSSLVFARSLQHFWLPASHLLGTCYLLDDLRSTHTPSKYLRATYSYIVILYIHVLCIYFL